MPENRTRRRSTKKKKRSGAAATQQKTKAAGSGSRSASRRGEHTGQGKKTKRDPWPWTDDDHKTFAAFVEASTIKLPEAKKHLARRAVEANRLCCVLDNIANKTAEELRAHNSTIKIYRRCIADLDLLDTTNKDEPGRL